MKDNLFDKEFTILDAVKILLLIVTAFSTWNVVEIMTPDTPFSFVRKIAALGVVEGAFIGFEMATAKAKSRRQTKFATIGFFCSLAVIAAFAGTSGLLEFGGDAILGQNMGVWLGITWLVGDAVMVGTLIVLVSWIVVLASLYRLYSLNDPDKRAELDRIEMDEEVTEESNRATRIALKKAQPQIASARARAHVEKKYSPEIGLDGMNTLLGQVTQRLNEEYAVNPVHDVAVDPERGFVPRVPPMQKEVLEILQAGARKVAAQVGLKPRTVPSPVAAPAPLEEPHYHPMTKLQPMVSSVANPIYDTSRSPIVFTPVIGIGNDFETSMVLRATPCINGEWAITKDGDSKVLYLLSDYDLNYVMTGSHEEKPFVVSPAEVKPAAGGDFRTPQ